MKYHPLEIAETMDFLRARRPFLAPVFKLFKPLLEARRDLEKELGQAYQSRGLTLPIFQREQALAGVPLLKAEDLDSLKPFIPEVTKKLLPLLIALPSIKEEANRLEDFFLNDTANVLKFFKSELMGEEQSIISMAMEKSVPPDILIFVGDFLLSALLRPLLSSSITKDDFPWNEEGVWSQGYCPVCGDSPVIAWLDRANLDEKNTFLVGGGGKKNFHCSLCGASWKFRRGLCPSCGQEGSEVMEILREAGETGERIDFCSKCKSYCPAVDLREFGDTPNMDVMAIGMLHLDIVASNKGLQPLKPAFWNRF